MCGDALTLDQEIRLVRGARTDARAFGPLYEHYFPLVYNYVFFRVRERAAADDLVSAIFMRAVDRLHTYREKRGPFGVWLLRVAHNLVVDYYRSAARPSPLPLDQAEPYLRESGASPEQNLIQNQRTEELLAQVARLPAREQEIISLKFGAGLTNRKIATLLNLKENHVAVILYRAVRKLRDGLAEGDNR